ncbi:MAG: hypothetical protein C5S46_00015, partial [Candidatus Methanomarinus sp.]
MLSKSNVISHIPSLIWSEHTTGTGMGGIDVAPIVGDGDVYVIDYQINTPVTYSDGKVYFGNWRGTVPGTLGFGTYYCVNADNICDQK